MSDFLQHPNLGGRRDRGEGGGRPSELTLSLMSSSMGLLLLFLISSIVFYYILDVVVLTFLRVSTVWSCFENIKRKRAEFQQAVSFLEDQLDLIEA